MTQKELMYFEDAIKHEDNIIKIIDLSLGSLENQELIEFMDNEREVHCDIKKRLINRLEVLSNEG